MFMYIAVLQTILYMHQLITNVTKTCRRTNGNIDGIQCDDRNFRRRQIYYLIKLDLKSQLYNVKF